MKKMGRRRQEIFKLVDRTVHYSLEDGIDLVKKTATAKFDESVEIAIYLNVDPTKAEQIVRGTVALPNGTGKTTRVLVVAKGEKVDEATEAGADYVGLEEYINKIQNGWFDFDVVIATPDVMGQIGKLGRVLGPRGLMPNPKSGTVTFDVAKAIQEVKAGRIEFRCDKFGVLHVAFGKSSFEKEKLLENVKTFIASILKAKPSVVKGAYVKSISLSTTMGVGIKLDINSAITAAKSLGD